MQTPDTEDLQLLDPWWDRAAGGIHKLRTHLTKSLDEAMVKHPEISELTWRKFYAGKFTELVADVIMAIADGRMRSMALNPETGEIADPDELGFSSKDIQRGMIMQLAEIVALSMFGRENEGADRQSEIDDLNSLFSFEDGEDQLGCKHHGRTIDSNISNIFTDLMDDIVQGREPARSEEEALERAKKAALDDFNEQQKKEAQERKDDPPEYVDFKQGWEDFVAGKDADPEGSKEYHGGHQAAQNYPRKEAEEILADAKHPEPEPELEIVDAEPVPFPGELEKGDVVKVKTTGEVGLVHRMDPNRVAVRVPGDIEVRYYQQDELETS